nr:hypothetical protein [Candidatus Saccharibacteria bacterium]
MQPTEPVSRPESNGVSPSVDTGGSLNSQSIRNRDADVIGATDMRQPRRGRWRVWLLTIVLPVFLVGGSLLYIIFRPKPLTGDNIKTTSVALEGALSGRTTSTGTQKTSELAINGDLRVGGKLTLSEQAVNNLLSVLGSKVELQASFPGTLQAGNINVDGTVGAGNFVGSGAGITNLNATNISSGTLSNARLSGQVTLLGQSIPLSALQANVISSINSLTNNGGNIDIVAGSNISLSASGSSLTISTTGGSVLAPGGTTNRLAKFSAPQTLVDSNIADSGSLVTLSSTTLVQPTVDSTTAFRVQNSTGLTNVLVADTSNARVAINQASASYALDVNGDINSTTNVRVGGVAVCSASGCVAASGNGNYIQNSTSEQVNANLNIKSAAAGAIGAVVKGTAAQTADILQLRDNSNNQLARFGATGAVTLQNAANSTNAFKINGQAGNQILNVDTLN